MVQTLNTVLRDNPIEKVIVEAFGDGSIMVKRMDKTRARVDRTALSRSEADALCHFIHAAQMEADTDVQE